MADQDRSDGDRRTFDVEGLLDAARRRDAAADARDAAAEVRDDLASRRDDADGQPAAAIRWAAATDREHAALDRLAARADRELLVQLLAAAEADELTGVRTRAAGLVDLEHEIDRARRNGGSLVAAYVDVVGLKRVNDSEGHHAGDELLRRVVAHIRTHLRPYDLIVRLGGDEFLCVMSDSSVDDVRRRFADIARELAASPGGGGFRIGLAALREADTSADLVARADGELLGETRDA